MRVQITISNLENNRCWIRFYEMFLKWRNVAEYEICKLNKIQQYLENNNKLYVFDLCKYLVLITFDTSIDTSINKQVKNI
jgi:hypothetical protein